MCFILFFTKFYVSFPFNYNAGNSVAVSFSFKVAGFQLKNINLFIHNFNTEAFMSILFHYESKR
jgi:hypothetical protein